MALSPLRHLQPHLESHRGPPGDASRLEISVARARWLVRFTGCRCHVPGGMKSVPPPAAAISASACRKALVVASSPSTPSRAP